MKARPLLWWFAFTSVLQAADVLTLRNVDQSGSPPPQQEARMFLTSICPGNVVPNPRGFMSCLNCPEFTAFKGETFSWDLSAIYKGHFTDPKADEAAVAMRGCEPHSLRFGGTALFARAGNEWKFKWYQANVITDDCVLVRKRKGQDMLVCADADGTQGAEFYTLSAIDLDAEPESREKELLRIFDNTPSCGIDYSGGTDTIFPLQKAVFRRISFDADKSRLQAEVLYGWRPYSSEDAKKCHEADSRHEPIPKSLQPRTELFLINFVFDGDKFELTPESEIGKRIVESRPTSNRR